MKEAGSQTLCLDAPRPFNFYQTGADEMVPAPAFLSAAPAICRVGFAASQDPCMMGTVNTMTVMQREACCAQGNVGFCATTTKAPVIIHDKPLDSPKPSPMCQMPRMFVLCILATIRLQ